MTDSQLTLTDGALRLLGVGDAAVEVPVHGLPAEPPAGNVVIANSVVKATSQTYDNRVNTREAFYPLSEDRPGTLTAGVVTLASDLDADAGRLIGVMGRAVSLRGAHLQVDALAGGATSTVSSAANAGYLLLSGDTLTMVDSLVTTNAHSSQARGPDLLVRGGSFSMENSGLTAIALGTGRAGDIDVQVAGELRVLGGIERSWIAAESQSAGDAGNVSVRAQSIQLTGAGISSGAKPASSGDSGEVFVSTVADLVLESASIGTYSFGTGVPGNVTLAVGGGIPCRVWVTSL